MRLARGGEGLKSGHAFTISGSRSCSLFLPFNCSVRIRQRTGSKLGDMDCVFDVSSSKNIRPSSHGENYEHLHSCTRAPLKYSDGAVVLTICCKAAFDILLRLFLFVVLFLKV